jgi:putative flippase GtrA
MRFLSKASRPNKEDFIQLCRQFIRFGLVGLSNTAISLAIYYIFIFIDKDLYLIGNTVGFVVSVLNSYYWSNKYVFQKSEKGHLKPLIKTYMSYGITFLLSTVLLFCLVEYLQVPETISPLIILIITIPMNFLLNKYWSFK